MSSAKVVLGLLFLAGCRDDSSCRNEGLVVSIIPASGTFEPGEYVIDVVLDDEHSTVVCTAGQAGLDSCELPPNPQMFPRHPFSAIAFTDDGDTVALLVESGHALCEPRESMPNHASVTVRRAGEVLVAEAWAPDYHVCRREPCRRVYSSSHELVLD
jgi:hypothetical protein